MRQPPADSIFFFLIGPEISVDSATNQLPLRIKRREVEEREATALKEDPKEEATIAALVAALLEGDGIFYIRRKTKMAPEASIDGCDCFIFLLISLGRRPIKHQGA